MLTNQEKIELRERAYRLANELVAHLTDIEGIIKEADVIYRFLSKDLEDDPLRLDTPSPVLTRQGELSQEEYQKLRSKTQDIDWSRPQLVRSLASHMVVQTYGGPMSDKGFAGKVVSTGNSEYKNGDTCVFVKSNFQYHGEIPQEQQEEPKTAGMNFLEAVKCIQEGKKVRRSRQQNYYQMDSEDSDYVENEDGYRVSIRMFEALATDWQIVKS